MKRKRLFIVITIIFSVLVFLITFLVIWFWGDSYPDTRDFRASVEIPGLSEGAVPQGIANYTTSYTNEEGQNVNQEFFFISAYMKKGPSRLYVTGSKTGYVGYVTMKYLDPKSPKADDEGYVTYYGHAGGVATSCKQSDRWDYGTLWMASGNTVYCAKRSSNNYNNIAEEVIARAKLIDEGENVIKFDASFNANCNASFCYFYEDGTASTASDKLYVGEFYRKGKYETAATHRVTTKNGVTQRAFAYEYTYSSSTKYGLLTITADNVATENRVPKIDKIFSIPDQIQGFARTANGDLVLSSSYGLPNSHLYYYKWSDVVASTNSEDFSKIGKKINFEYDGILTKQNNKFTDSTLKVYSVNKKLLIRDYSIPAMSEGLCVNGDRVYVLFESGSYKYRAFVRQHMKEVMCFVPRTLHEN